MKVATVIRVAVIHPGHGVSGSLLNNHWALWANPGFAILGICARRGDDYVFDAALGLITPRATTCRL